MAALGTFTQTCGLTSVLCSRQQQQQLWVCAALERQLVPLSLLLLLQLSHALNWMRCVQFGKFTFRLFLLCSALLCPRFVSSASAYIFVDTGAGCPIRLRCFNVRYGALPAPGGLLNAFPAHDKDFFILFLRCATYLYFTSFPH